MSLLRTSLLCIILPLLLFLPPSAPIHIKHSSRLDTRVWRRMMGQRQAGDRKPAEEKGVEGAFEADMRLTPDQLNDILTQQRHDQQSVPESMLRGPGRDAKGQGRFKRKAVAHASYLWPSRTVPYRFHHSFPEDYKDTVLEAMQFWQRSTCVQFVPFSPSITEYLRHMDHVTFTVGEGCQSSIGRVGMGEQTTEIASHCNEFGSVAHEIGHVLGFYHEQSRPDRDDYVTILRENIRQGRQHNFLKYTTAEIITAEPYDIGSVMHYGPTYFSKDGGSRTIDTADETYRAVMGQRNAPSFIDVKTANDMYSCNGKCAVWPECANHGYVGPDCTCMCPTGLGGWDCTQVKESTGDCGGVLTAATGTIESPGYGFGYDINVDCLWLIQAPSGSSSISLTVESFELEDDAVQPCAFDWLEVRTQGPHLNGQRFCGAGPSSAIEYQGRSLVVHFHSDDSYTFGGFRLRYVTDGGAEGAPTLNPLTQQEKVVQEPESSEEEPPPTFSSSPAATPPPPTRPPRSEIIGLTPWTPWSECSRLCEGGLRSRLRTCRADNCGGSLYEQQDCNDHPCDSGDTGSDDNYYGYEEEW